MLGFVQDHGAQGESPKLFLIGIAYFRVVRVRGGPASWSLLLDQVLGGGHIYPDVSINGGFAQQRQPFLVEVGAMEQRAIRWTRIDQERTPSALPIRSRLRR